MELTEKEYEDFLLQKKLLKNIFDVLVFLYSYIDGKKKSRYRGKYFSFLCKSSEYWKQLELLNNEMLEGVISFDIFLDRFWELLSRENIRYYAFKMLFTYDRYIKENYETLCCEMGKGVQTKISCLGPMNTICDRYFMYIMPKSHFFKDYNDSKPKESRIRFMNQSEFDSVDPKITSYKIIRKDKINGTVKVIGYNEIEYVLQKGVKIAIVPLSPCKWFKDSYLRSCGDGDEGYIIVKDDEDKTDRVNRAYKNILQKCIEEEVGIVIFPELARNKKTLEIVKKFLAQRTLEGEKLPELIFLGTLWDNYMNEGILLNGAGTELLRTYKKHAYKTVKEDVDYWEQLMNVPDEITLLDVPGLGRIQYSICKDGLDVASQTAFWSIFEISLSVISAYSGSLRHFADIGSIFAKEYGGIQIVANACAIRMEEKEKREKEEREKEKKEKEAENEKIEKEGAEEEKIINLGNVIIPCAKDKDMGAYCIIREYKTKKYCWKECKKNEEIGRCIQMVSIFENQAGEKTEPIDIELETIIL